jgi:hypothetical protein
MAFFKMFVAFLMARSAFALDCTPTIYAPSLMTTTGFMPQGGLDQANWPSTGTGCPGGIPYALSNQGAILSLLFNKYSVVWDTNNKLQDPSKNCTITVNIDYPSACSVEQFDQLFMNIIRGGSSDPVGQTKVKSDMNLIVGSRPIVSRLLLDSMLQ